MDGTRRADIRPGLRVFIVLKKDQRTGKLTEGIVQDILTKSPKWGCCIPAFAREAR